MSARIEVRRRVWAWDARRRGDIGADSILDGIGDAIGEHPVAALGFVAIGVVGAVALPFLLLAVELAVVLVATIGVVVTRVVLRRPWRVEARFRSNGSVCGRWAVHGFRAAGRARDQLQRRVDRDVPLPPDGPYDPEAPPAEPSLQDPLDDPTWPQRTD